MTASVRRLPVFVCVAAMTAATLLLPATARGAATIVIQNNDGAGEGFNDPTAVAPVGGNPGTTLGQQRLIAFQHAANIWGATLNSVPTITIRAFFNPLTCTASTAVLGSAGPISVWRDFAGAPVAGTWYAAALANALSGSDLLTAAADPNNHPEINATFNSNLGQAGCLTGSPFYLGLDNNHGTAVDLVTELLHEFAHGLGFSTSTSVASGNQLGGYPSAFDHFLFDNTQGLSWPAMTNAQRVASAHQHAAAGVDGRECERGSSGGAPAGHSRTRGHGANDPCRVLSRWDGQFWTSAYGVGVERRSHARGRPGRRHRTGLYTPQRLEHAGGERQDRADRSRNLYVR